MSTSTTDWPAQAIRENLLAFLARRTGKPLAADTDLFASGLVSSMFALELVVHVEGQFGVSIEGRDLRLENFCTVDAMTGLVLRLRGEVG